MKILCIDDEPLITRVVARVMFDHEVVEYSDACLAIFHLTDGPQPYPSYDVIMCDVIMPNCSGVDVYKMVSKYRPEIAGKIVFTTGAAIMPGIDTFLESVPNVKVDKPFRIDHIRSVLLEVGSRKS